MMRVLCALGLAAGFAIPAFAGENNSTVDQTGIYQSAVIDQSGDAKNTSYVKQDGQKTDANVLQRGADGTVNDSTIEQVGGQNAASNCISAMP